MRKKLSFDEILSAFGYGEIRVIKIEDDYSKIIDVTSKVIAVSDISDIYGSGFVSILLNQRNFSGLTTYEAEYTVINRKQFLVIRSFSKGVFDTNGYKVLSY